MLPATLKAPGVGSALRFNLLPFHKPFLTGQVPFVYLLLTNGTALSYAQFFTFLLTAVNAPSFKVSALQNQKVLSFFFHSHEMHLLALLFPFTPNSQIPYPFIYLTVAITRSLKKVHVPLQLVIHVVKNHHAGEQEKHWHKKRQKDSISYSWQFICLVPVRLQHGGFIPSQEPMTT